MQQVQSAATEVFSFPLAIALIPAAVCIVCIALGVLCFRRRELRRFGYMLFIVALVAGGLFAPAMLQDRILVSPREIATTTGFWFAPTREGFVYRDVQHVRVTTSRDPKGRVCPAWEVHYRDGRVHLIQLSDLWNRHSEHIRTSLQGYGVSFSR
jgi:uncharacterized integral membrane protein